MDSHNRLSRDFVNLQKMRGSYVWVCGTVTGKLWVKMWVNVASRNEARLSTPLPRTPIRFGESPVCACTKIGDTALCKRFVPGPCTLFLYLRKFFLCPCISILCPWTLFLCFHISTLCPCRLFLYQANFSYRNTCAHYLYALVQIIPMPVHIIPMPAHIIYMPAHIIYMTLHIIPMPVHIIATPVPNCTGTGE